MSVMMFTRTGSGNLSVCIVTTTARNPVAERVAGLRSVGLTGYTAAIGSIRLGSLFLTLPTRALTGQHVICSDGYGARRALSWCGSAASSPSQADHALGPRTTGIRL